MTIDAKPKLKKRDLTTLRQAVGVARAIDLAGGDVSYLVLELEELLRRVNANREIEPEEQLI